ncbi:class III lanthionine synthetase LanKC [Saccharothrix sp. ST-888]|uniref:class III lanthionine synthetase LanKC n=1 Tax=Saccharothrix sp. ST-888 TaxID=1427391 RepID=UPI000698DE60|nr:class III lanthionine synthetase LanKC [Saccharothrix sp. ST-888]
MRYEAYSYADPLFYDSPVRWAAHEEFAAVTEPLPPGWVRQDRDIWVVVQPAGVALPDQGWKIHVSACLDNAERVLDTVRSYCQRVGVPFKYLRSLPILQVQNSKYANRGGSGKFCTLYPLGEDGLRRCLTELGAELAGEPGPYILSDLRWEDGPLYLRYGAFTERWCRADTGEQVPALADPEGRLVPDVRAAVFEVPSWAPVPDFLGPALAARRAGGGPALPYRVERALHFSNAGGIYLAHDRSDGTAVVLKEARPHAGLDQRGADAVTRLGHEYDILARLAGIPAVPALHGRLTSWEHHFLVQEYIEGTTLNEWLVQNYPLVHPDPDEAAVTDYVRRALDILDQVERGLAAIHARGVVFGDLHPRNLMLRPDGSVVFIDFELASPIEEFVRPALGAAGFAAPAGRTGVDLDHHALAALRLWLLLPLQQLLALDPGKTDELIDAVERRFPLPDGYTAPIRTHLVRREPPLPGYEEIGHRRAELTALLTAEVPDWKAIRGSLAAGIAATATPDRADRLFPGDVAQFTHDSLGLAYGAAGVLYALDATGCRIDPEHLDWLTEAAGRSPVRPGLYTGSHGVAYTLDLLGARAAALDLLDRLNGGPGRPAGADPVQGQAGLGQGQAGIALTLLHFAEAAVDPALLDRAIALAEAAADTLTGAVPGIAAAAPGLLSGPTGAALALLRLYEHTGDVRLLDRAEATLTHDLERCVLAADGTVQVRDGLRVLPYLEGGSAGIGLVLDQLLTHRPDSALRGHAPALIRAAEPEFIIQPGLFNGRAGLLGHLGLLRNTGDRARCAAHADRHRKLLSWHQISYRGELAFPGEQLLRLSADLATGSAGVLLALGATMAGTPFLPWTAPIGRPGPASAR